MMHLNRSHVFVCLLGFCLLTLTGCNSFDRAWNSFDAAALHSDAAPGVPSATADPMIGKWSGSWTSTKTGHDGELRALITPAEKPATDAEAGQAYDAWFWAKYAGVLTFDYTVRLIAQPAADPAQPEKITFTGEADLGSLAGGIYQYAGYVLGEKFDATYEASSDVGVFEMTRVTD